MPDAIERRGCQRTRRFGGRCGQRFTLVEMSGLEPIGSSSADLSLEDSGLLPSRKTPVHGSCPPQDSPIGYVCGWG
jgi:hypothetical protein